MTSPLFRAFVVAVFAAFALVSTLPIVQPVSAAIVVVAADGKAADVNNDTVTTADATTTGATFVAMGCSWYSGTTSSITASDSKSNTYRALTKYENGNPRSFQWFYVNSATPTVGANHAFTCAGTDTFPTACYLTATGAHATPFGQENGDTTASAETLDHNGGLTPAEDNELILSGIVLGAGTGLAIDGGFTAFQANEGTAFSIGAGCAYLIQTTAAAANPSWSWTDVNGAASALESFKMAASGPPSGSLMLMGVGR